MSEFVHERHKPALALERPRELILACPPLRSHVNLSRIVRAAASCGVLRIVAGAPAKVDPKVARDGARAVRLDVHRTLPPVLARLRQEGFRLVGLEQATNSQSLPDYRFERRSVLVLGHERDGMTPELLALLHDVVEIPVWGPPFSYNVATAAAMALYEYCRQFPRG